MPARMTPDERLPLYQQLSDEMLARIAARGAAEGFRYQIDLR